MATRKKDADNVFTTSDGIKIRLNPVDPIFIQGVIRSVKDPEPPTYTQYIGFNKRPVETKISDEETASQVEGGIQKWREYQEALAEASAERTDRSLRAIFLSGTEPPDNDDWANPKWISKVNFLGINIPEDRQQAWVIYLLTAYDGSEILQISQKIMRLTGVPEEMLAAAEETFQSSVQDDGESE